jgi:hypothetical protein
MRSSNTVTWHVYPKPYMFTTSYKPNLTKQRPSTHQDMFIFLIGLVRFVIFFSKSSIIFWQLSFTRQVHIFTSQLTKKQLVGLPKFFSYQGAKFQPINGQWKKRWTSFARSNGIIFHNQKKGEHVMQNQMELFSLPKRTKEINCAKLNGTFKFFCQQSWPYLQQCRLESWPFSTRVPILIDQEVSLAGILWFLILF